MKIVGVGCGPGMLSESAIDVIRSANRILGSQRAIDIALPHIPPHAEVSIIEDYKGLRSLSDDTVLLSTGDPMISGLGYLGGEITPGISSVQLGAARTGITLTNLFIITAHGRNHEQAIQDCCEMHVKGRKTCIIADPSFPVEKLSKYLNKTSIPAKIILCENLGYPDEHIYEGTDQHPPDSRGNMFVLFITNLKIT